MPGKIWKLNKVVYGLCDASRSWYLKVVEVLEELGMRSNAIDPAVFTYEDQKSFQGALTIHVDDILFFGTEKFLEKVMSPFKQKFRISKEEENAFKYLGIEMTQGCDKVVLDQNAFLPGINVDLLAMEECTDSYRYVNDEAKTLFRRGVGQLVWLANITKPEAHFHYYTLSTLQRRLGPQLPFAIHVKCGTVWD